MFRCENEGFEAVVFGAYDGVTSWTNNAYLNLGSVHQEVVGAHEERHMRLQKGTPWGALLMLVALRGDRDLAVGLADACRETHESYATFLSTAHIKDGIDALKGNSAYLHYWRVGASLADVFDDSPNEVALSALEFLFHLTMSPSALGHISLTSTLDELYQHSPDSRLAQITSGLREYPGVASEIAAVVVDGHSVDARQDSLSSILTRIGIPTLDTADQLAFAERIMREFNDATPGVKVSVEERSRATALTDQLAYQQYEVLAVQPEPIRLRVGAPEKRDGEHPLTDFVMDDEQLGPHVWGVMLTGSVLSRQFAIQDNLDFERAWGLLAVDRRASPPFARFWPLDESPAFVSETLAESGIQCVLMTTMSTLNETWKETAFSPAFPVFVLVDYPVLPFFRGLIAGGDRVRWSRAESEGDRRVHFVILTLDDPSPMHFVVVRSAHTVRATSEWLQREPAFLYDPSVGDAVATHLSALAAHLLGTFWALESVRPISPT